MDNDGRKPNDRKKSKKNSKSKPKGDKDNLNRPSTVAGHVDLVDSGVTKPAEGAADRGRNASGGGASDSAESKQNKRKGKENSENALVYLFDKMKINLSNAPAGYCFRPEFKGGRLGKKVILFTNFFKMSIRGGEVYRYDVTFQNSPIEENEFGRVFRRLAKNLNQRLLLTFITTTGRGLFQNIGEGYAYDNDHLLITNKPITALPSEGETFIFQFQELRNSDQQRIEIKIKPTGSIILEPNFISSENIEQNRSILQVVDIISKKHAFMHNIVYGDKIFFSGQFRRRIPMKTRFETPYELAFGYHQSTRLCQSGVMQNIDRVTAVFFKGGPLIDTMKDLLGHTILDSTYQFNTRDYEALRELTHLRVETNYRPYSFRFAISSFSKSSCKNTFFPGENGKISVYEYFRERYPHIVNHLRYPHLPCVVNSKGMFIPVELCTLLPDQRNQRRLREELIRFVSQHTTTQRPAERLKEIEASATQISKQKALNQFQIELIPTPVTVESRILNAPNLQYARGLQIIPKNGDWDMRRNPRDQNDQQKCFFRPIALTSWALLTLSRKIDEPVRREFVSKLQRAGSMLGMEIKPPMNPHQFLEPRDLDKTFKICASKNLQLIVIIMPKSDLYNRIKAINDQVHGIPSQVISDAHYDNRARSADQNSRAPRGQKLFDSAYLNNLLLKINAKLGGINTKLTETMRTILNETTMVVGIDVNHPAPGEHTPSIAAVVGSIDNTFSKYRTEIRVNEERVERVPVDQMIGPILEAFRRDQGSYPRHIIVYRDGVGEGDFPRVMTDEIHPLCCKLRDFGAPELTYIIVQKRHNARFFPLDPEKGTKSGNILPGSVIDTDICHYKWFDFYLCSQNSFLGTARPSKYTVLWNLSSALADDLQMATYYLCYLFARATKSIADPAPARYAHHAAARGKVHLLEILRNRPRDNEQNINIEINNQINANNNLKNILYFI